MTLRPRCATTSGPRSYISLAPTNALSVRLRRANERVAELTRFYPRALRKPCDS